MNSATSGLSILVVEDDELLRELVTDILHAGNFSVTTVENASEAKKALRACGVDLLITDLNLPGESGLDLIRYFRKNSPDTFFIVITGYPDEKSVKIIEELEVSSFLVKPFSPSQLHYSVLGTLEKRRSFIENQKLQELTSNNSDLGIVGISEYVKKLREEARTMSGGDFPVLIQGESGTGKEVLAHAIHACSIRGNTPMITINCAAIPKHLEESEFFGHSKGAFTGAHSAQMGILESAHGSSVFLDEIGELSLEVQAKLLRVLDTGEFTRIGDAAPRKVDIRIISATNRDLLAMVNGGGFRKDLYFRLRGGMIVLLPLREHLEDIPCLVRHFLRGAGKEFTGSAMRALATHAWPGNVRELKHSLQLMEARTGQLKRINETVVKTVLEIEQKPESSSSSFCTAREDFERDYFIGLLRKHGGNVSQVAKEANIHRPNLIRKLKELGISADDYRQS